MAKVATPTEEFGYKWSGSLTVDKTSTVMKAITLTPEDSDLHDISKEGILITRIQITPAEGVLTGFHVGLFNKTTDNDPIVDFAKASWDRLFGGFFTTSGACINETRDIDLRSMPGGGIPMVADFITMTTKIKTTIGADLNGFYCLYYKWIALSSEDYRKILYARSV